MSNFFTGIGDDGVTSSLSANKISKSDPLINAVGVLDETTASLGLARSFCTQSNVKTVIKEIQNHLYQIMAEISQIRKSKVNLPTTDSTMVIWLEDQINEFGKKVKSPQEFTLPGDSKAGGVLSLARTITRRAERYLVQLNEQGILENPEILRYINRLSSLCYVMELYEDQEMGIRKSPASSDKN